VTGSDASAATVRLLTDRAEEAMPESEHEEPEDAEDRDDDQPLDDLELLAKHAEEDRAREQDHADADVAPSDADGDPDLF
jgi:hypothetical protein